MKLSYKTSDTIKRLLLGILFLGAGIGYIGKALGYFEFTVFYDGWWTIFFLLPAVFTMLDHGINTSNTMVFALGVYFLASAQGWIDFPLTWPIVLAVFCICIGLKLIFRKKVITYEREFF